MDYTRVLLGWTAALGLTVGCTPPPAGPDDSGDDTTSTTQSPTTTTTASASSGTTDATTVSPDGSGSASTGTDTVDTEPVIPPIFDVGGISDMGASSVTCSSDLKHVINVGTGVIIETCEPDEGCLDGQCVPACLAASEAEGSMGCEFIIPTSPFYANDNPAASQAGPCHALLVSNPWDRPAVLELERGGMTYDIPMVTRVPDGIAAGTTYDPLPPGGVPSGQVAVVFLAHRPGVANGTSLECPITPAVLADTAASGTDMGEAFQLMSDTPVQVYDMLPYGGAASYLPSASLIYPSTAWGDSYLPTTPHPPDGLEWLLAVARDDNTVISIVPSVAMTPGAITNPPVSMTTQYTVNAGEVVQWLASGDPIGTIITADKPIGVFTGNTYLRVTTADNPSSGRDSAHQMVPDVNALASEYVGAGLFSRLAGFANESVLYRIVGVVDGTNLQWDPGPPMGAPMTLGEGEVFEFESTEMFTVTAQDEDHPFSLSQYMSGTLSGQPGCTNGGGTCALGDDEWVVLVPPAQFLRSYAFFVDPTYGTSTLVMVREAGATGFEDVELDCMGTVTGWMPVGNDGRYEYAHVELFRGGVGTVPACETSQHLATSQGNFGIVVWGTDSYASYGYPAGGNLQTLNQVDVGPAG